jgi:geranylgeranyl pyrophosphate synthase
MSSLHISSLLSVPKLPKYLETINHRLTTDMISGSPSIDKPLSRLLKARGKRLRPLILIAVAASQKKTIDDSVISSGLAIELVHLGSLVHDDIIDDANSRWNIETINSKEGQASAIVIGDLLLAKACYVGASVNAKVGEKIAQTITELCVGQSLELADLHNLDRTKEAYIRSIKGKTAALMSASCEIGGICAGLDEPKLKSLATYGLNFGISFQLIDDLIDLLSTTELIGKPAGNDVREGVYTMPLLYSLSGPYKDEVKSLLTNKEEIADLVNILLKDSSIERTITLARKYNQLAVDALYNLEETRLMKGLLNLPEAYLNWCLRNLIAKTHIPSISNL